MDDLSPSHRRQPNASQSPSSEHIRLSSFFSRLGSSFNHTPLPAAGRSNDGVFEVSIVTRSPSRSSPERPGLLQTVIRTLSSGLVSSEQGQTVRENPATPPLVDAEHGAPLDSVPHSPDEESGATVAEEAERHRLTANISEVDIRSALISIERSLPFVVLLLIVLVARHYVHFILYGWCSAVLWAVNTIVNKQIMAKGENSTSLNSIALIPLVSIIHAGFLYEGVTFDMHWVLLLQPVSEAYEFFPAVWTVIATDFFLRFISLNAKAAVLMRFARCSSPRMRRARGYKLSTIEYCSAFYRSLIPIPLWTVYFMKSGLGIVSGICVVLYLLLKGINVYARFKAARRAVFFVLRRESTGLVPTEQEAQAAGNICSICHDTFNEPIKIQCGHIFCENCLEEWLARDRTCPICRSTIHSSGPKARDDGSTPMFPMLF